MTCYHPLKGFVLGTNPSGKRDMKVVSGRTDHLEFHHGRWHAAPSSEWSPYVLPPFDESVKKDFVYIPCGQCIGCRIDKSRQWANRMMLELQDHEFASFVTLTYSDENIPISEYVTADGEVLESLSLDKTDFQKFMKRLRKHFSSQGSGKELDIRFYACGEYGSNSLRPHYHAVLFGVDFSDDREFFSMSPSGYPIYTSPTLQKLWPFGYSTVQDVDWQSCAYVARYVQKKRTGRESDYYDFFNIDPEFALMSRRPGIGRNYYDEHRDDIYLHDEIFISTSNGGKRVKPPRYFDSLYDVECPEEMEAVKIARQKMADNISSEKLKKTDLSFYELLEVEERNFKDKAAKLRRDGI